MKIRQNDLRRMIFIVFCTVLRPVNGWIMSASRRVMNPTLTAVFRSSLPRLHTDFKCQRLTKRHGVILKNDLAGLPVSTLPKNIDDDEDDCEIDLNTMKCVDSTRKEGPIMIDNHEEECEIDMDTMQPLNPDKCLS